jgi:hypothetical protein
LTVLATDGVLWEFDATAARSSEILTTPFQSQSQSEMRASLIGEFGHGFDVTGTGTYLVVHPAGQKDQWAQRFEDLYRQMLQYFSVRGIDVKKPTFPLVAVVFPTQEDFLRYAQRNGGPVSSAVLGYYSVETNRIYLFDVTAGGRIQEDWRLNAETIVHEAAHQTAFNVGIHSRFAPPPRWVCEGLGTLFEAPGVYDSLTHRGFEDRVNAEQLRIYRARVGKKLPPGILRALVATDNTFRRDPVSSYAISWAATFMFAEQESSRLAAYLKATASKRAFEPSSPGERLRDFERCFGNDFAMLESRVQRFVDSMPK